MLLLLSPLMLPPVHVAVYEFSGELGQFFGIINWGIELPCILRSCHVCNVQGSPRRLLRKQY